MQKDIIEEIKSKLDIAEFIRQYVPDLKRMGKTYKACCPFHHEKTPSFTCSSEKGLFYCFGCQEGGDIFAFLMKIEHLSFNEAAKKLAEIAGVEYRPPQPSGADEIRRTGARKVLDFARGYYHKIFMSAAGEHARAYVKGRHLTKETCQHFELGLSPAEPFSLARNAQASGFTAADLVNGGLCKKNDYGLRDYFRGRLMFPIINQRGDTVGFGGRSLDGNEPKYLNSPETVLFTKSRILYGLNFAGPSIRQTGRAVLLEGYMDVIGCHQAGITYTVAPLGTGFTEEHARLLKRYTQNAIVLFDPDEAGIKAALRGGLILIGEGLFVKVASLPEGLDPDEFIIKYGKEKFEAVLDSAQDLAAFHTQLLLSAHQKPLSAQDKTAIISVLAETIAKQPDAIVRREWAKHVAEHVGVAEELVLQRVRKVLRPGSVARVAPVQSVPADTGENRAEADLFAWVIKNPQYIVLCAELTEEDFSGPRAWELFNALVKARQQNPQTANLAEEAAPLVDGDLKKQLIKYTLTAVPEGFEPERDINACVAKLARAGVQKKINLLHTEMKKYPAGQVPQEVFKKYMDLQQKLKNYRS